ncbi:MAG: hypothetical protein AAF639_43600 [Chloroflexota bacterium]
MKTYQLSDLTQAQLLEATTLDEKGVSHYPWLDVADISLTSEEQLLVDVTKARLSQGETMLMNEATIWARGIYPLLILAERGQIRAWAEVALSSTFSDVKLTGTADGVLARVIGGIVRTPYLVTLEAKRSVEAKNPQFQFLGQLLVAAKLNWQGRSDAKQNMEDDTPQEIFGCYTIGDVWTFARATVQGLDESGNSGATKPLMTVETSREFVERLEAETILKILKKIVARYEN